MANRARGLLERVSGSGVWWIRWTDHHGKRHLEKAGRRGDAIDLLSKRKHETLLKKKLSEKLRGRTLTFSELSKDALAHSKEENGEQYPRAVSQTGNHLGRTSTIELWREFQSRIFKIG